MTRSIRPARQDDVPLIADVLEMASRGHLESGPWDFVFPDFDERRRALEMLAGGLPSWCHHREFRVAENEGGAAAALVAFEPRSIGGTDLGPALGAIFTRLGFSGDRIAAAAAPIGIYLGCFPDMPEGDWIVECVGTRPAHRRRGLVADLLADALAEGRRRGHGRAQISCLIGNDPARLAYERVGFRVVEERKSVEFEALMGSPGFVRMTRAL